MYFTFPGINVNDYSCAMYPEHDSGKSRLFRMKIFDGTVEKALLHRSRKILRDGSNNLKLPVVEEMIHRGYVLIAGNGRIDFNHHRLIPVR